MSTKVFLGIQESEGSTNNALISEALQKKYVDCHIDCSAAIDAAQYLEQNTYDLIIADTTIVRLSILKALKEMNTPFLYVASSLKETVALPPNIKKFKKHQEVVEWINNQKVTNEDLAKSLRNTALLNKSSVGGETNSKGKIPNQTEDQSQGKEHVTPALSNELPKRENRTETKSLPPENKENAPIVSEQKEDRSAPSTSESSPPPIAKTTDDKVIPSSSKSENPPYFDELYGEAIQLVLHKRSATVTNLQDAFKISFEEGANLLSLMEKDGIIGSYEKGKTREVLLDPIVTEPELKHDSERQIEVEQVSHPMVSGSLEEDQSDYIGKKVSNTAFVKPTYNLHRTIGIWSPQGRTGTTTFTMNFAMYLGKLKYNVAVLEGISNRQSLKMNLQRFTDIPDDWVSWASTLFKTDITDKEALNVQWVYNNVSWLPLDGNDPSLEWSYNKLFSYINNVKKYSLVLVDFPGGYMDEYSLFNLDYLDELWIMMDNNLNQMKEIKKYIHDLVKEDENREAIPIKLICNHKLPFSKCEDYAKVLDIPLLASIPSLNIETQRNLFQRNPLIEYPDSRKKMIPSFEKIRDGINTEPELEYTNTKQSPLLDKIRKYFIKH